LVTTTGKGFSSGKIKFILHGGNSMGFSVQNNLTAMNSNRMLGLTSSAQASSTEKLSSGYKINRAADDAAGLSISEKMRRQIRGLTQASANAEDGISSVQTAEGALTEVHDMLQRMNELANKASNGTMSEDDRQSVQDEIDQLLTEVDRVAETSKFNEIYLLKGNAEKTTSVKEVNAHDAGLAGDLVDKGNGTATFTLDKALKNGDKVNIGGTDYTIGSAVTKANFREKGSAMGAELVAAGDSVTVSGKTYTLTNDISKTDAAALTFAAGDIVEDADGNRYSVRAGVAGEAKESTQSAAITTAMFVIEYDDDGDGTAAAIEVKNAIDSGWKVIKNGTDTTQHTVVSSLKDGEVSTTNATMKTASTAQNLANVGSGTTVTFSEGDTLVQSGNTITATDQAPEDYSTIEKTLNQLAADGTTNTISIAHTENGVTTTSTYKLATANDFSDSSDLKATREYILDKIQDLDEVTIGGTTNTVVGKENSKDENAITVSDAYSKMADALQKASSIGTDAGKEAVVKSNGDGSFTITKGSAEVKDSLKFSLHVGADADMTNKISVNIDAMDTAGLGIQGLDVTGTTVENATYSIDAIEDAIKKVSEQRSALGAVQNRLEHTIKNLDNIVENTTSAESQIRDTDMATEMVKFSNLNILAQAGTSMLAQANQSSQNILSLLG
jgi:flagellin-like hook-associated protein FlgL